MLVQENQIEGALLTKVKGILTVGCRNDLIFFLFEEDDVGFQQFNLVIHPQQCSVHILKDVIIVFPFLLVQFLLVHRFWQFRWLVQTGGFILADAQ